MNRRDGYDMGKFGGETGQGGDMSPPEASMRYLDLAAWPRKEHFAFFSQMAYPHFNICANVDITRLLPCVKERRTSFYHTFIYLTSRVANGIAEFRYRIRGQDIVEYDAVHPSFTVLEGAGPYRHCAVEYKGDISEFCRLARQTAKELEHAGLAGNSAGRDDLLYITCMPWVSFTACTHPISLDPPDSIPRLSWGAYFAERGRVKLPLSVQVNHAVMDGYHVGGYFEQLQDLVNHPERFF